MEYFKFAKMEKLEKLDEAFYVLRRDSRNQCLSYISALKCDFYVKLEEKNDIQGISNLYFDIE